MLDESISVSKEQAMIIYVRFEFQEQICSLFWLISSCFSYNSANGLKNNLCNFLFSIWLSSAVLEQQAWSDLTGGWGVESRHGS